MKALNRLVNVLNAVAGSLAAVCLVVILCLIIAQIVARQLDTHIPSSGDVIGYAIVWATFLGLPYTMGQRGHIRVELILSRLDRAWNRRINLVIGLFATVMLVVLNYYIFLLIYESWQYEDVTEGEIPMPLWLVQLPMIIGSALFTLSMLSTTLNDFFDKSLHLDDLVID